MTECRFWRLNQRPVGNDFASALSLEQGQLSQPAAGEVLVKADYLSMDPGVRVWMTARQDSYSPPIALGSTMQGQFIGSVIASQKF